MKKIITALLAMVMLFSIVACAKEADKGKDKDQTTEKEGKIWDKQGLDFDGYEFTILGMTPKGSISSNRCGDDIDVEELTGNEVLDAVYTRNRLIEQTYNCTISLIPATDLKNTLMAGSEEDGNIVANTIRKTFELVEEDLVLDLNDPGFKYLQLDEDWYSQSIQKDTEIAGKLYFVNGDMLFTDENSMWVTFFNKELAARYLGDVNLYDLVRTGKWTIDEFNKYAALAATEILADDKLDMFDQWGYVGEAPNVAAFVTGAGYRYASITEDGGVVSEVFDPEFQDVFRKCFETVDKKFCLLATDITGRSDYFNAKDEVFTEGRALFSGTAMSYSFKLRDVNTDFGILPNPKLDEKQENYYTWTTYHDSVVSIPYTCTDYERTSAIMEALFEESKYTVRPAYVDKALKYQSTRDDDSIEMLDIVIESTVHDIGVVYDFGGIYSQLNSMVQTRMLGSLSSTLKKGIPLVESDIKELLTKFQYEGQS